MTRVPTPSEQLLPLQHRRDQSHDGPLGESRRDIAGRSSGFLTTGDDLANLGDHLRDPGLMDRSDDFHQRLRRHEKESDGLPDPADLAAAGLVTVYQLQRSPEPVAATPQSFVISETRERLLGLAERCEKALTAELYMQAGRPVAVELAMGDLVPGLDKIAVSMTSDRLEICLFRNGGEASSDLVASAQALADRLQIRFSRRLVRVVEQVISADLPVSDGQAGLARLFAPRETGS